MPSRGLTVLATATAAAVVACWFAVGDGYSEVARETREKELIFPEFQRQLAGVTDIEAVWAGGGVVVSRRADAWANMGLGGFPAVPARVESLMIAVAGMKYIAPRTKRSEWHHRLQVEDVTPDSGSARLIFKDDAGAVLADVIIGKPKDALNQSTYVRLPGDAQAWLAEGRFDIHRDAAAWSDQTVVDFDARSLNALTVRKNDRETVSLYRDHPRERKMKLKNLPAGATVEHQYQIEYLAGLLRELRFIGARRTGEEIPGAAPVFEVVARWNKHLEVTLHTGEPAQDGSVWARIDARITNASQASNLEKQEAARIQSGFSGWDIKLPRKFTDRLDIQLHDIIGPEATNQ